MLLYGKNSISERLKAKPQSIRKIFLQENFKAPHIEKLIKKEKISTEFLPQTHLANMKRAKDLQGIIARVDNFKYTPFEAFFSLKKEKALTLVFLDKINDPHNLGVIIRTIACFGGFRLVIPEKNACEVNETVLHVASGGESYVSIAKVADLSSAIKMAKAKEYKILGASVSKNALELKSDVFSYPMGLVLGSEAKGISPEVKELLDKEVYIPMKGAQLSLNVNMACAILCYEISTILT